METSLTGQENEHPNADSAVFLHHLWEHCRDYLLSAGWTVGKVHGTFKKVPSRSLCLLLHSKLCSTSLTPLSCSLPSFHSPWAVLIHALPAKQPLQTQKLQLPLPGGLLHQHHDSPDHLEQRAQLHHTSDSLRLGRTSRGKTVCDSPNSSAIMSHHMACEAWIPGVAPRLERHIPTWLNHCR